MATDDPALRFMDLRVILRQWARMPPEALSRDAEMRAGLVALTRRASTFLRLVLTSVVDNDPLLGQVFEYIIRTDPNVKKDDLIDGLKEIEDVKNAGKEYIFGNYLPE